MRPPDKQDYGSGIHKTFTSQDGLCLHYVEYSGPNHGLPVLCMPGLSRNARDFTSIAEHLSADRRVYCADFRGRGQSQWDPDPTNYQAPLYVIDMLTLLAQEKIDHVLLIGTSLGGIVGTGMVQANPTLVAGLILNDIGPVIDPRGLARIGGYLGKADLWSTWEEAASKLKAVNDVVYPDFSDADWVRYAQKTCRKNQDGLIVQDYDPRLSEGFAADSAATLDLWSLFEGLKETPTLLLRGELSDLLSQATAQQMLNRLPNLSLEVIKNRGHVPTLDEPDSRAAIESFIAKVGSLDSQSS
ncbi:MAG: alpha/beta hydrolase [Rhodospirillaceae bacterium]